jgi:hypothetical protein
MTLGYSTTLRNARLDAITAAAGASALLKIYDGARPATGGAATTLLATLTCNATFAPAAAGGVLTLNAITGANAVASSTATWARITTSGGTFVADCSVAASGADINLNTAAIVSGAAVAVTSAVITEGNA